MGQVPLRPVKHTGTVQPVLAYPPSADSFETLWKKHSAPSSISRKAVLTRASATKLIETAMAPLETAISSQEITQALAKTGSELEYEMTLSLLTKLQSASPATTTQSEKHANKWFIPPDDMDHSPVARRRHEWAQELQHNGGSLYFDLLPREIFAHTLRYVFRVPFDDGELQPAWTVECKFNTNAVVFGNNLLVRAGAAESCRLLAISIEDGYLWWQALLDSISDEYCVSTQGDVLFAFDRRLRVFRPPLVMPIQDVPVDTPYKILAIAPAEKHVYALSEPKKWGWPKILHQVRRDIDGTWTSQDMMQLDDPMRDSIYEGTWALTPLQSTVHGEVVVAYYHLRLFVCFPATQRCVPLRPHMEQSRGTCRPLLSADGTRLLFAWFDVLYVYSISTLSGLPLVSIPLPSQSLLGAPRLIYQNLILQRCGDSNVAVMCWGNTWQVFIATDEGKLLREVSCNVEFGPLDACLIDGNVLLGNGGDGLGLFNLNTSNLTPAPNAKHSSRVYVYGDKVISLSTFAMQAWIVVERKPQPP